VLLFALVPSIFGGSKTSDRALGESGSLGSQPSATVFVVLPALTPDIPAVHDLYFAAFATVAVMRVLFMKASTEHLTNAGSDLRYGPIV
jgi:hypothetical protein